MAPLECLHFRQKKSHPTRTATQNQAASPGKPEVALRSKRLTVPAQANLRDESVPIEIGRGRLLLPVVIGSVNTEPYSALQVNTLAAAPIDSKKLFRARDIIKMDRNIGIEVNTLKVNRLQAPRLNR